MTEAAILWVMATCRILPDIHEMCVCFPRQRGA